MCRTMDVLEDIDRELKDRFGDLPLPVQNLLSIVEIRIKAEAAGIESIGVVKNAFQMLFASAKLSERAVSRLNRLYPDMEFRRDRLIYKEVSSECVAKTLEILGKLPQIMEKAVLIR